MSELSVNENNKALIEDDELTESEASLPNSRAHSKSNARRRLESLLEERRLRDELEDGLDY